MTEVQSPTEPQADRSTEASPSRLPIGIRLLGIVGFAALLVAIFAFVRSEPEAPRADGSAAIPAGFDPPAVGVAAPDFSVSTMSGGTFTLSEHFLNDGRPVFLNFWGSWCFPCTKEMPDIQNVAVRHPDVFFIGVAIREQETPAREFATELGVTYEIGFDENGLVEAIWDIWPMPETYLIGTDGIIKERTFGPRDAVDFDDLIAAAFSQ
jgi:thiol-disulfide isomerase/thioredoxin